MGRRRGRLEAPGPHLGPPEEGPRDRGPGPDPLQAQTQDEAPVVVELVGHVLTSGATSLKDPVEPLRSGPTDDQHPPASFMTRDRVILPEKVTVHSEEASTVGWYKVPTRTGPEDRRLSPLRPRLRSSGDGWE